MDEWEPTQTNGKEGMQVDQAEFAARIEQLKARLYRTAYLYLGSEAIALDAVDEAVYKGLNALPKLRQPEYFDTWMTRILINECKQELRRRKRELSMDALPETAEEQFDALSLKEAIRRLPPELKDVILLRFFTGLTQTETAQALSIPQGTVATRQRRALSLLKLELEVEP